MFHQMKSGRQKHNFQTLTSWKKQAEKVLRERQCFREAPIDIAEILDSQVEINLTYPIFVNDSYRRVTRKLYEEVQSYVDSLMTNKWVRQSNSAYTSPMVCVRKNDGSLRVCIDY